MTGKTSATSAIASLLKVKLTRLNYALIESSVKLEKEVEHDESFVNYMEGALEVIKLLRVKLERNGKEGPVQEKKEVLVRTHSSKIDFYGDSGNDLEKVICVSNRGSEEDGYSDEGVNHFRSDPQPTHLATNRSERVKTAILNMVSQKGKSTKNTFGNSQTPKASGVSRMVESFKKIIKGSVKEQGDSPSTSILPRMGHYLQNDQGVIDKIHISQVGTKININLNTKNNFEPGVYTIKSLAGHLKASDNEQLFTAKQVTGGEAALRPRMMDIFRSQRGSDCEDAGIDSFALCNHV